MEGVIFVLLFIIVSYILAYYLYKTFFFTPIVEEKQLRNRRVVITGASRGIGEELAYEYARYNCRIVLAARSTDVLRDKVAKKCRALGAKQVEYVTFDASDEKSCTELIKETIKFYGGIDILVLNHTASVYEPFFTKSFETNIASMKTLFNTNFFGYFHTAMAALPHLTDSGTYEQPSHIIAVSSLAGTCPMPKTTLYGTTKHAIQGFFLNLARELQTSEPYRKRITVTVATLGLIATDTALEKTEQRIHSLAADVRKTAQAMIAAGVNGQTRLFYPRLFILIPPLNYIFFPLFELVARLGN